ncbi:hypothetical protein B0H17DRAFT_701829 [Mycena rosella]|uniref:Uncharacterized protein n=1 Tax=Mycena rosella TaxID=1033263 RepID=A0AAD7GBT8_MYCRO|nr:hypothetical protein B0H17DRAFT_701829 [Mycena rosella]
MGRRRQLCLPSYGLVVSGRWLLRFCVRLRRHTRLPPICLRLAVYKALKRPSCPPPPPTLMARALGRPRFDLTGAYDHLHDPALQPVHYHFRPSVHRGK